MIVAQEVQITNDQLDEIINRYDRKRENLIQILIEVQNASGLNYISKQAAARVARQMDIPLTQIYDVITFYAAFSVKPRGKYVIQLCRSTPCHVKQAEKLAELFKKQLNIQMGEVTKDRLFSLEYVECVGACGIGPVVKIGEKVYGDLNEIKVANIIRQYREGRI